MYFLWFYFTDKGLRQKCSVFFSQTWLGRDHSSTQYRAQFSLVSLHDAIKCFAVNINLRRNKLFASWSELSQLSWWSISWEL